MAAGERGARKRKSPVMQVAELVGTVVVAIVLALVIQALIVKPYRIPSGSMIPTLSINQRVLTNRLISHPSVGDVVVFHPPQGADSASPVCGAANEGQSQSGVTFPRACGVSTPKMSSQTFIKRVVAGPGDRLAIRNGHVIRNGVPEKDPYIAACTGGESCTFPQTITVPPGEWFMMGDNRGQSDDSRFWGPVPNSWIIGVAFFTYWPPDRVGTL